MSRTARIVIADVPHHITQRGNNRQDVFFTPEDRREIRKKYGTVTYYTVPRKQ